MLVWLNYHNTPLHLSAVAIEKGVFGLSSTMVANFTYIYVCVCVCVCVCVIYFYFRLLPNVNTGRVKKPKWSNLWINKYTNWYFFWGKKKFYKNEKTEKHMYCLKKIKQYRNV